MPKPLQEFLEKHPEARLPNETDTPWKEEFIKGAIRPYAAMDTNRDGIADVVAVVVEKARSGLLVFHGKTRVSFSDPLWVLRDEEQPIFGVDVFKDGTITPLFCYLCDANPAYRWDGRKYDVHVFLPKEVVCVAPTAILYSEASVTSKILFRASETGEEATVVDLGEWRKDALWYRVRVDAYGKPIGFITGKQLAKPGGLCK